VSAIHFESQYLTGPAIKSASEMPIVSVSEMGTGIVSLWGTESS
jgi:hypothetical protein